MKKIKERVELFRDVAAILGIGYFVYYANLLYSLQVESHQAQVATLKEEIELLKERQFDRAATIIKSQKELSELELDNIEKSIQLVGDKPVKIRELNGKLLCLNLGNK